MTIRDIGHIILFAIVGGVFGLILDKIFILIQNKFKKNRTNKCIFTILQLFISIGILWILNSKIICCVKEPLSGVIFITLYYNSQTNLWNNLKEFKYVAGYNLEI